MSRVHAHTITHTLETVVANFRHWRAHRTRRSKVPPELMEQAAALVGHYPVSKVSTSLGLDFNSFKRYCRQRSGIPLEARATPRSSRAEPLSTAFVEIQTPPPVSGFPPGNLAGATRLELRRSDGATLQIHCAEPSVAERCIAQFLQG